MRKNYAFEYKIKWVWKKNQIIANKNEFLISREIAVRINRSKTVINNILSHTEEYGTKKRAKKARN